MYSTEALWPGRHIMCGRSHNCCNQSTWFISYEAKATPWFPCESWSKTLGQGYDPSEHFFCTRIFTNSYLNVWSCLPSPGKNGKPYARNILTLFPLLVSRNERHDLDRVYPNCGIKDQIPPKSFCIQTLWEWTNIVRLPLLVNAGRVNADHTE